MKKNTRNLLIALCVLVVLALVFLAIWNYARPQPQQGSKAITVDVVDDQGETKHYSLKTDEEYLHGALNQIDGLTLDGYDSDYGYYVTTVNGLRADYTEDGAYWSFYINGDYCTEGVDSQVVTDGDAFTIQYELAQ